MATMELTNIHMKPAQKHALQQRAKTHGTNVSEEIRRAVDAYLTGATPEEIRLLDAATRNAEAMLREMQDLLENTNRKAEVVFSEMAKLRGGYPEGTQ